MQPLYYLPGIFRQQLVLNDELSRPILARFGIDRVFADVTAAEGEFLCSNIERGGPDGKTGCILAYATPAGILPQISGFYPDQQTWNAIDGGRVWIGLSKDQPTTPDDLRRRKQYQGARIELAQDRWQIPVIRRVDDSTELPRDCYFDRGQLVEPIKEAYRQYWQDSAEVAAWLFEEGGFDRFDKPRALTLAVDALSLNYRYGQDEQTVLRRIDSDSLMLLLAATVDYLQSVSMLDAKKKGAS